MNPERAACIATPQGRIVGYSDILPFLSEANPNNADESLMDLMEDSSKTGVWFRDSRPDGQRPRNDTGGPLISVAQKWEPFETLEVLFEVSPPTIF